MTLNDTNGSFITLLTHTHSVWYIVLHSIDDEPQNTSQWFELMTVIFGNNGDVDEVVNEKNNTNYPTVSYHVQAKTSYH